MSKLKDLVGHRARLLCDLETLGGSKYPKGTVVIITSVWRGRFTLASTDEPKPGYGRKVLVRQVHRRDVEVLG